LISWTQSGPDGGRATFVGRHGSMKPEDGIDFLGVLCWLLRDQMLAKINAGLYEAADDKAALSQEQREIHLSEIERDRLMTERQETCIVWSMMAAGDSSIEHRADADVRAVLGIELRTLAAK
jgi:hypothetical protein